MKQKKNKKVLILIIIIIVLVLILLLGSVYAYFSTDILKSNKELFFKYLTQTLDDKNGFIEDSIKHYSEKKKNTPYSDQGTLSVNITAENGQSQFENTNKVNLTFDGQVNNSNNQMEQNLSLNYSENVKVPVTIKKDGDEVGFQYDKFGDKFITIDLQSDNSSIKGVDDIEKVQDLTELPFDESEFKNTTNTYFEILNKELKDSNFSKIDESNSKGYKLTLKGEELKNIAVKLLEKLKNDQTTIDKINEYLKKQKNSFKLTLGDIEQEIEKIQNNQNLDDKNIEISVFKSQNKTNQVVVKVDDIEFKIQKRVTGNDTQYGIELQRNSNGENTRISLLAKFQGLQALQSITENYELILEDKGITYQYNFNNNVEFIQGTNIKKFNDENSINLSKLSEEQRSETVSTIIGAVQKINKKQMAKLGLEDYENPLLYVIPPFITSFVTNDTSSQSNSDEDEITSFNKKFEMYEVSNLKGVTVKGLLTTINLQNESNRKIKEIHFNGEEFEATEQNISVLKENVELEAEYRVEFEKDEDTRCNL